VKYKEISLILDALADRIRTFALLLPQYWDEQKNGVYSPKCIANTMRPYLPEGWKIKYNKKMNTIDIGHPPPDDGYPPSDD
jgi:hypothetical protein